MTTTLTDEQIEAAAPAKFESAHWFKQGAQWARDSIAAHQAQQVQSVEAVAEVMSNGYNGRTLWRGKVPPVGTKLYPASALAAQSARIAELEKESAAYAKNLRGKYSIAGATYQHMTDRIATLEAALTVAEFAMQRGVPTGEITLRDWYGALTTIRAAKGST